MTLLFECFEHFEITWNSYIQQTYFRNTRYALHDCFCHWMKYFFCILFWSLLIKKNPKSHSKQLFKMKLMNAVLAFVSSNSEFWYIFILNVILRASIFKPAVFRLGLLCIASICNIINKDSLRLTFLLERKWYLSVWRANIYLSTAIQTKITALCWHNAPRSKAYRKENENIAKLECGVFAIFSFCLMKWVMCFCDIRTLSLINRLGLFRKMEGSLLRSKVNLKKNWEFLIDNFLFQETNLSKEYKILIIKSPWAMERV